MRIQNLFFTGTLIFLSAVSAHGQVLNPSFESSFSNWTQTGNVGILTSLFGKTPTHGTNMAYLVAQNTFIPGITSSSQVSALALATALGTTTTLLNTAAGAGHSVTTGIGAEGGSGISQSITVAVGSTLTFDWDFLTTEDVVLGGNNNDFGFISINGVVTVLGRPNAIGGDPAGTSAFHYIPYTSGALDGSHVQSYLFETGDGTGNAATRTNDYNNNTGTNFGAAKFQSFTTTFSSAGPVQLGFGVINVHTNGGSVPSALLIDNLKLTSASSSAPEPGTLALLTCGLGGAALLRRRSGK